MRRRSSASRVGPPDLIAIGKGRALYTRAGQVGAKGQMSGIREQREAHAPPPTVLSHPGRLAAVRIVRMLRDEGFEALLAGGCVRDEVMGLTPKDYDVATNATPAQVQELFRNTRAVGEHFGVVIVRLDTATVEVATFRTEGSYSDRRRPDRVEFTDAPSDAQRRDFTINGLFRDPVREEVVDYVGGLSDIRAGVVRAIGDPEARLAEDHLRALRAIRFAARFGFSIDRPTAEAIRRHARDLLGVSRERIGEEIRRMLTHPRRAEACRWLEALALDGPVLGDSSRGEGGGLRVTERLEEAAGADFVAFGTALAAWALDRKADSRRVARQWRKALVLSNVETDLMDRVVDSTEVMTTRWTAMSVSAKKRMAGETYFGQALILLRAADAELAGVVESDIEVLKKVGGGINPKPFITGDDLTGTGLPQGPVFKELLDHLYDEQLEGRLMSRQQGMEAAHRWMDERRKGTA